MTCVDGDVVIECVFFSPKKFQTNFTSWADVAEKCSQSITCMQAAEDELRKIFGGAGGSGSFDQYKVCLDGIPGNGQSVAQCMSSYKGILTSFFSNMLKNGALKLDLSSGGTHFSACKLVIASCSHELSMCSSFDACIAAHAYACVLRIQVCVRTGINLRRSQRPTFRMPAFSLPLCMSS
jgi:hypothetical protein